ncbi:hypothetical protein [Chitinophaga sp. MM2321]|uniref:hypothetical protein n=1 Tax=Chitinophaga sp. MM2321 TaxID=3137178 RepID=UPI0032D59382
MNIKIRNGIQVEANGGLIVEQAWLQYASGPLVRDGNIINVGEKIKIHLIIQGWKGMNDVISIGASERITTDEGQCLLEATDMFADYATLSLQAVQKISLSAVIDNIDRLVDYFKVDFRIWSKMYREQEITGYYQFHI